MAPNNTPLEIHGEMPLEIQGEMQSSEKMSPEYRPKVVSMTWNDSGLVEALEESAKVGVLVVEDLSAAAPFQRIE